jgi:hypothetical protein
MSQLKSIPISKSFLRQVSVVCAQSTQLGSTCRLLSTRVNKTIEDIMRMARRIGSRIQ